MDFGSLAVIGAVFAMLQLIAVFAALRRSIVLALVAIAFNAVALVGSFGVMIIGIAFVPAAAANLIVAAIVFVLILGGRVTLKPHNPAK